MALQANKRRICLFPLGGAEEIRFPHGAEFPRRCRAHGRDLNAQGPSSAMAVTWPYSRLPTPLLVATTMRYSQDGRAFLVRRKEKCPYSSRNGGVISL